MVRDEVRVVGCVRRRSSARRSGDVPVGRGGVAVFVRAIRSTSHGTEAGIDVAIDNPWVTNCIVWVFYGPSVA